MKLTEEQINKAAEEYVKNTPLRHVMGGHIIHDYDDELMDAFKAAIELLMPVIEKQGKVIVFYANKKTWLRDPLADVARIIEPEDCSEVKDYAKYCGGKLARLTQKEVSEYLAKIGGEG